jgi:hypothetical protein
MNEWTNKKPNMPGWYWARWWKDAYPVPILVSVDDNASTVHACLANKFTDWDTVNLEDFHSFQGPIAPAQEAS